MHNDNTAARYPVIRLEMLKKGLSIVDLAKKMDISYNTLRNKLDGTTKFYLDEVKNIAQILSIPIEDLAKEIR